jgi:hypothetical protein
MSIQNSVTWNVADVFDSARKLTKLNQNAQLMRVPRE